MASVLDYSKWDNLEVSDDEEDEVRRPIVHRLNKPTSVTFGGTTTTTTTTTTGTSLPAQPLQKGVEKSGNRSRGTATAPATAGLADTKTKTPAASHKLDDLIDSHTQNGASTDGHMWSQSRSDVTVRVFVPYSVRAKDININVPDEGTLSLKLNGEIIVGGTLSFPIIPIPHMLDVDWEIDRHRESKRALVRVTLQKKIVSSQIIVWWDRVFKHEDPQIDVKMIEARRSSSGGGGGGGGGGGVQNMENAQSVWAEAHRMFREKVAARKNDGIKVLDQ